MITKSNNFLFAMLFMAATMFLVSCDSSESDLNETIPESKTEQIALKSSSNFKKDLVFRWAPIHHMDVDATGKYAEGGKSDYITAINYDGDWNAENNWNNLGAYSNSLTAHCYYSLLETDTHWYITYAFFHPRDWTDVFFLYSFDQHENDLEGVLMIVEKNAELYGVLRGAVTVSHSDFFSFVPAGSTFGSGHEDVDGELKFINHEGKPHPVTAQEAKGHGLKAFPYYKIKGDGIKYYPSRNDVAQKPSDNYDSYVEYKLVDIFEPGGLWDQRSNSILFSGFGNFKGNDFKSGGANAPWGWNDGNDGTVETGEIAIDPAKLTDIYFSGTGNLSRSYTYNPYQ